MVGGIAIIQAVGVTWVYNLGRFYYGGTGGAKA